MIPSGSRALLELIHQKMLYTNLCTSKAIAVAITTASRITTAFHYPHYERFNIHSPILYYTLNHEDAIWFSRARTAHRCWRFIKVYSLKNLTDNPKVWIVFLRNCAKYSQYGYMGTIVNVKVLNADF
jgi:hypothetical protein